MQRWTHEQHMYMNLAPKAESPPHFTQCVFEKKKKEYDPCDVGLSEECSIKWRDSSWTPVWASSPTFVCTVGTFLILLSSVEKKNVCICSSSMASSARFDPHAVCWPAAHGGSGGGGGRQKQFCIIWGWGWLGVGLVRDWCWLGAHLSGLTAPLRTSSEEPMYRWWR